MNRRNFLNKAAVTSACAVAGTVLLNNKAESQQKQKGCKITVVKCSLQKDLLGEGDHKRCPREGGKTSQLL